MIMRRALLAAVLISVVPPVYSAEMKPNLSKQEVLNLIASFRGDPLSERGRLAGAFILAYVKTNPAVIVQYTPRVLPISDDNGLADEDRGTLMAAYAAGNVQSQLSRRKAGDDPYTGDLQLIETYRKLQRRNSKLKLPPVEKLDELE